MRSAWFVVHKVGKLIAPSTTDDRTLELPLALIRGLLDAPSFRSLEAQTAMMFKRGWIVGSLLSSIYVMVHFNVPEPSMNKALWAAAEYARRISYGDGSRMMVSERINRKYVNEFRSVAHLWAAFVLNGAYPYCEREQEFHNGLPSFLGVAAALQDFGLRFVPKRTQKDTPEPFLREANTWLLPARINRLELRARDKPDLLLELLSSYKTPFSKR